MKTTLPEQITTIEEAQEFLLELHRNGESYHPEDQAKNVVWYNVPEPHRPTKQEQKQLDKLMGQILNMEGFDPCAFLLGLVPHRLFVTLNEFANIASELSRLWHYTNDETNQILNKHYPREWIDFEKMAMDAVEWDRAVSNELRKNK